jgi:hypothetical protein
MKKTLCIKCGYTFVNKGGNYNRHFNSCNGKYSPIIKLANCKYCNIPFTDAMTSSKRANHSRWCHENPLRDTYGKTTNTGSQLRTPEAIEKRRASIKKAHAYGKYKDASTKMVETKRKKGTLIHTEKTKKLLSKKALASPHRRLRKNTIEYNGILLDSTWELALAQRLDNLRIKWIRPKPIKWVDDDGVFHNYFADFYLQDYDLYLDPKNPQALKVQKYKLSKLLTQYNNIVIIKTIQECENFTMFNILK